MSPGLKKLEISLEKNKKTFILAPSTVAGVTVSLYLVSYSKDRQGSSVSLPIRIRVFLISVRLLIETELLITSCRDAPKRK